MNVYINRLFHMYLYMWYLNMLMNYPINIIIIIGLSLNRVRELRNLVQQARQKVGHARQQSQHRK